MFKYGVYTSSEMEIVLTKKFVLMLYAKSSVIGIKLYQNDNLIAECERDLINNVTTYAFGDKCKAEKFNYDYISELKLVEEINISETLITNPTVSDVGIAECLRVWKLGNTLNIFEDAIFFTMNTKKIEYIVMIREINDDIYCGASINVPYENGLFGGQQYFRIRNNGDNTAAWCGFHNNLGQDISIPDFEKIDNKDGQCLIRDNGIYWGIKSYTDDEIILQGCGDDEYVYSKNLYKTEIFI